MNFARNERLESDLLDRFCRYVQIDTTSDRQSETKPSSQSRFVTRLMWALTGG